MNHLVRFVVDTFDVVDLFTHTEIDLCVVKPDWAAYLGVGSVLHDNNATNQQERDHPPDLSRSSPTLSRGTVLKLKKKFNGASLC